MGKVFLRNGVRCCRARTPSEARRILKVKNVRAIRDKPRKTRSRARRSSDPMKVLFG